MKPKFLLIVFLFLSLKSFSQNYIPMNLDTSCYWVNDFHYYDGFSGSPFSCTGETTSYVEKDSLINNTNYKKVITYSSSDFTSSINTIQMKFQCYSKAPKNISIFLREDTIQKKIFYLVDFLSGQELELLDFGLNIGDSVHSTASMSPIVDSLSIVNFNGINRNVIFSTAGIVGLYSIIEGVGASYNFPLGGYGEWLMPIFALKCYSKGGQILYGDTSQPCLKRPAIAVSTKDVFKNNFTLTYSNNSFQINNPNNEKLNIVLLDLTGNKIISETTNSIYYQSKIANSISTGIYFLQVGNEKGRVVKKIIVE